MNIVYCFSKNWLTHVQVQIYSLLVNNTNEDIKIYLLTDELVNDEMYAIIDRFSSFTNCELIFINMSKYDSLINETNVDNRFTKYTLYRLLIPKLINESKVLYLDADTLVINSLADLYNLDPISIIGVVDKNIEKYADKSLGLKYHKYINAGVLLMNLDYLRSLGDRWLEMVNTRLYSCHDQDIINLTCVDTVKLVDNQWNSSVSTGIVPINKINIYHWAGKKPWIKKHWLWGIAENRFNNFNTGNKFIPKVIYTCWFGDNPKNGVITKCNESWYSQLPDYSIVEYNQDNFDLTCNSFIKQCYIKRKFAFISDYVRVWTLHKFGGIYLDSDVEVLKNLDKFLDNTIFTGKETDELWATAVMGCLTEYGGLKELVDYYDEKKYTKKEKANTRLLSTFFRKTKEANIYDIDVFCPFNHREKIPTPTENSYTIHHFNGSWKNKYAGDIEYLNYYSRTGWCMENYERLAVYYLLQNMPNKNNALEVGSMWGGLLNVLSEQFKKVVSIDVTFKNLNTALYDNVTFIENSCTPNGLLNVLDMAPFNLVVIDADHEYKFVFEHMNALKTYIPKQDMFILIHDTWYGGTRNGINNVNWNENKYIHFIDLDFVPGVKIEGNKFVGGLCLIIMKPIERANDIGVKQMKYHYNIATR